MIRNFVGLDHYSGLSIGILPYKNRKWGVFITHLLVYILILPFVSGFDSIREYTSLKTSAIFLAYSAKYTHYLYHDQIGFDIRNFKRLANLYPAISGVI